MKYKVLLLMSCVMAKFSNASFVTELEVQVSEGSPIKRMHIYAPGPNVIKDVHSGMVVKLQRMFPVEPAEKVDQYVHLATRVDDQGSIKAGCEKIEKGAPYILNIWVELQGVNPEFAACQLLTYYFPEEFGRLGKFEAAYRMTLKFGDGKIKPELLLAQCL